MVTEQVSLLGLLLVIIMIYFFLYKRSKIIGTLALLFTSLAMLVPFGNTNYEMIAWIGIIVATTALITEFSLAKMGAIKAGR